MSFAEKLSQLMDTKAVTNYRLAKDLGIHASTIAYWRNGQQLPRISHVKALSDYFKIPMSELIDGIGNVN